VARPTLIESDKSFLHREIIVDRCMENILPSEIPKPTNYSKRINIRVLMVIGDKRLCLTVRKAAGTS
jgi:hypothetical protein